MELENISEYFETKVFQDFGQNLKSYHVMAAMSSPDRLKWPETP